MTVRSEPGLPFAALLGLALGGPGAGATTEAPTGRLDGWRPGDSASAPTPGAIGRIVARADALKRVVSGGVSGRPTRVRPRSTGSHKQNRRRALAGR